MQRTSFGRFASSSLKGNEPSAELVYRTSQEGDRVGYDWSGARGRRMKLARFSAAVTLAALLVGVAIQVVGRAL